MTWRTIVVLDLRSRAHRGGRWALTYLGATVLFVAVVRLLVTWTPSTSDAIYLATGLVILCYTIETWRLRKESQLQTELQNRPFLVVECPGAGLNGEVLIRNVGRGIAINVSMVTVEIEDDVRVQHLGLMHLRPGEAGAPRLAVVSEQFGVIPPLAGATTHQQAVLLLTTRDPVLHLDYESNVRQRYRASFALDGITARLQGDSKQ